MGCGGKLNERKSKSKTLARAGRLQTSIVPISDSLLPDTCLTCQPNFVALAPSNSKPIQSIHTKHVTKESAPLLHTSSPDPASIVDRSIYDTDNNHLYGHSHQAAATY
jgi:hypothetical protein